VRAEAEQDCTTLEELDVAATGTRREPSFYAEGMCAQNRRYTQKRYYL
jgi:hypothetical protein